VPFALKKKNYGNKERCLKEVLWSLEERLIEARGKIIEERSKIIEERSKIIEERSKIIEARGKTKGVKEHDFFNLCSFTPLIFLIFSLTSIILLL